MLCSEVFGLIKNALILLGVSSFLNLRVFPGTIAFFFFCKCSSFRITKVKKKYKSVL